jgi:hypothetical protein
MNIPKTISHYVYFENPELRGVSPHYDFVLDGEDGRPCRRETIAEGPVLYLFRWIRLY